jgi:hypothetical protein
MKTRFYGLILAFSLITITATAQDRPIGYWRAHLPYNTATGVATDGTTLYVASGQAFFTLNTSTNEMNAYSKVDGMSDVGTSGVAYDMATSSAVIVYSDANIDIFKDNTFYNIPDFKIRNVAGVKSINATYTENGTAYLSTSQGILVIDLTKRLVTENYQFYVNNQIIPVYGYTAFGNYYYTITSNGLYRADKNSNQLQNFAIWQQVNSRVFKDMAVAGGKLFLVDSQLYVLNADTLQTVYHSPGTLNINGIDGSNNNVFVNESSGFSGRVVNLNAADYSQALYYCPGIAVQTVALADGSVHIADALLGLGKVTNPVTYEYPDGPNDPNSYGIWANNKDLWVTHGGFTDALVYQSATAGFSHFNNDKWTIYSRANNPQFDSLYDFVPIVKDINGDGTVYAGCFQSGLFELKPDSTTQIVKQGTIDPSVENGAQRFQIFGLAFDHEDNLWMTGFGSTHELMVKSKTDGNWYKFVVQVPRSYPYGAGPLVVDNDDQLWYTCPFGGGAIVYNTNGTPTDASDDTYYHLNTGVGYGNLPSANAMSIACDKNGDIWIGTDNGIGIVSCTGGITSATSTCRDANIPIVQYDQYAGYLFAGENVRAIAVDGGNRKWVGTDNGVWLLSPDASKIVLRFTKDNSPLPSNRIEKIAIDGVTGDVYIGTDHGLMSYRGTATDGGTSNQNVMTFPNPVPSGYNGTIAIKGLVANADVRITDISGQLVYKTIANGGEATWGGVDYTGHRPASGVYLIFVTNSDGTQTYAGKMVFMN